MFLAALRAGKTVKAACADADIAQQTARYTRTTDPAFALAWDRALAEGLTAQGSWRSVFLAALRAGKTVKAACANAGITKQAAYAARKDSNFARSWALAIAEGTEGIADLRKQLIAGIEAMDEDTFLTLYPALARMIMPPEHDPP